jgi:hypothetical protein
MEDPGVERGIVLEGEMVVEVGGREEERDQVRRRTRLGLIRDGKLVRDRRQELDGERREHRTHGALAKSVVGEDEAVVWARRAIYGWQGSSLREHFFRPSFQSEPRVARVCRDSPCGRTDGRE